MAISGKDKPRSFLRWKVFWGKPSGIVARGWKGVRALLAAERHCGSRMCASFGVVSSEYNNAVIELERPLKYDAVKARVKKALLLEEFALKCVEPAAEPPEDADIWCDIFCRSEPGARLTAECFDVEFPGLEEHVKEHEFPLHVFTCHLCKFWKNRCAWSSIARFHDENAGRSMPWLTCSSTGHALCTVCGDCGGRDKFSTGTALFNLQNIKRHAAKSKTHADAVIRWNERAAADPGRVTTPSAAAPAHSVVDLTAAADVEGPATKKRKQIPATKKGKHAAVSGPATKKGKHAAVSAAATIWQSLRNRSKPRQAGTASIGVDAGAWGASKIVVENAE